MANTVNKRISRWFANIKLIHFFFLFWKQKKTNGSDLFSLATKLRDGCQTLTLFADEIMQCKNKRNKYENMQVRALYEMKRIGKSSGTSIWHIRLTTILITITSKWIDRWQMTFHKLKYKLNAKHHQFWFIWWFKWVKNFQFVCVHKYLVLWNVETKSKQRKRRSKKQETKLSRLSIWKFVVFFLL